MKDIEDIIDIRLFVNEFYNKVQRDALLGPVFHAAIKDWGPHLEQMYGFWNAALFGVPGFKGNPFAKHATLNIRAEHFQQWLLLFNDTIDSNFEGSMAEDAKGRAVLMAKTFITRLENPPLGGHRLTIV